MKAEESIGLPYDPNNKSSVIEFAKQLIDKTLRQACGPSVANHQMLGKGHFGQILEKFYFKYSPNSISKPDFPEIGLELKSSPLKQNKRKEYLAKERLVLGIIDYHKIIKQDFFESDFWKKNANLLLVFYLHDSGVDVLDFLIKLVDEWNFPPSDLEIIRRDWELIQKKVRDGKAHEISEGDTFYLGACTKGENANSIRKQPNSEIPAKQRAYSLKQGYVNHVIATIAAESPASYGRLISNPQDAKIISIEEIVVSKFKRFYGLTVEQISERVRSQYRSDAKNYFATLTKLILEVNPDDSIEEFLKADIVVRTVRLRENNMPQEDVSFPNFKFEEIVNQEWDNCDFKSWLERKYLFIFYQYKEGKLYLIKAKFWNMPYADILEAKKVWEKTKEIVSAGEIVSSKIGKIRKTNFPSKKFSRVAHVRPHASNSDDVFPLPIMDRLTGASHYTKHCFWLNNAYIRDQIFLLD